MRIIYIGYWNNKDNMYPDFPLPVEKESKDNSEAIKQLKFIMENSQEKFCKGASTCRCCGNSNGTSEFVYQDKNTKYIIPSGYMHYLDSHGVKPSPYINEIYQKAFVKFQRVGKYFSNK